MIYNIEFSIPDICSARHGTAETKALIAAWDPEETVKLKQAKSRRPAAPKGEERPGETSCPGRADAATCLNGPFETCETCETCGQAPEASQNLVNLVALQLKLDLLVDFAVKIKVAKDAAKRRRTGVAAESGTS